ncbi:Tex family protein [Paenibacillus taichungensis]|uniref:RNA-binding transcriptional accessory protein n=1 Tax=Paenibacillus taichungensis TaxID=484184 RepID=A0ABX2MWG0_9BACL|nr:Tex family protein [Paenibacillus taichungensis]OME77894.1 RNA-binding transcriptional accessory protein [Paenibacillus pabuli]MDR9744220.1 Tex family protein [Paenibacillus taichungensis]MEC0106729.1 Tex family protein [Paenibacillus taichungensis]MEC0195341.1 Tex family protein [Paenibacillus taichungensis]NUU58330.1 RNA-binding transcriptional accessory protein [Paenibacillus taichungensis]
MSEQETVLEPNEETIKAERHERIIKQVAKELSLSLKQVRTTSELLDEGNTIPFIARYRKEMTGELDENQLRLIEERIVYLRNLEDRKVEVIRIIEEQGKLTGELKQSITQAVKLQEVEDLYRPFRQKRKTRASVAKEKGLEPLAVWIWGQPKQGNVLEEAARYINAELGVEDAEVALQGAKDILAENIADDAAIRAWIRRYTLDHGMLTSEAKDAEQESVYENYYDYRELAKKMPPHRILAINRGERENILKVGLDVQPEPAHRHMEGQIIKGASAVQDVLRDVIEDAYKRLIAPSIEREVRAELTEKGENQAISVFSANLRNLLLQPPIHGKRVLGVDPAYRTGCKLAVVDDTGKLLEVAVTYPTPPHNKKREAAEVFHRMIKQYDIGLIVIGNGTGSRETEQFVAEIIQENGDESLVYLIVNEAGASVYSASKLAQEEFPDLDVAERSAASIARRVQDPLAELVKIDPKAIGVGQYQHDVSQKILEESLKAVVESAVNHVGVDVNTASPSLLSYVAGVNATIAKNIVKYREENGRFTNRRQLQKVPRLGAKTYEQCVGFMRIGEGENPLDRTPIHPESYKVVDQLFKELQVALDKLGSKELSVLLSEQQPEQLAVKLDVGVPTLRDILDSLQRPGRDPREEMPLPIFRTDVLKIEDLVEGMELQGTVRNVIDFGAFVDIGIKSDGLVHISQLSNGYVKHPMDVVSVGDNVTVWVMNVDTKKGRVGLTMKKPASSKQSS